jgi:hypothetical protein
MALTIENIEFSSLGNRRVVTAHLSMDGDYQTGGYALAPKLLRMRDFMFCLFETKSGYLFEYDYSDEKLKAMNPRSSTDDTFLIEVDGGGVDVKSSAINGPILSHSGTPGMTGGAGSEVLNGTDLHLIKEIRCFIVGY